MLSVFFLLAPWVLLYCFVGPTSNAHIRSDAVTISTSRAARTAKPNVTYQSRPIRSPPPPLLLGAIPRPTRYVTMGRSPAAFLLLLLLLLYLPLLLAHASRNPIRLPSDRSADLRIGRDDAVGAKWAVLIAGSRGFYNYRHQIYISGLEVIEFIGKLLFGSKQGSEVLKTVRPAGQPVVDDWSCLKSMVRTFESHCGSLSQYGMKHMRSLANICNAGISKEMMAEVSAEACISIPASQWSSLQKGFSA
ncbi:hypothetical protein GW17_00049306 [Ensete ventricosum]|nr:hypothetical protein GW17_00049306 [Ensete ventricosum]